MNLGQRRATFPSMSKRRPPDLEMTLEGEFVEPPPPRPPPILSRIMVWAIIVAAMAGALAMAAFALWLMMIILPVAVGAGAIAYGIYRFQVWRARGSIGSQRDLWRP